MGIKSLPLQWPLNVYLYTNGLYRLKENEWDACELSNFELKNWKSSACIIAREHYIEEQRTYPIGNFYHLLKIIKAEKQNIAPFEAETFWAITQFKPGEWQVTYWSIQQHVIDILRSQFKFVIPESYLLAKSLTENGVYRFGDERGLYLHKDNNKFVCMIKDPLVNSVERFCALLDVSHSAMGVTEITTQEYQQALATSLGKLSPHALAGLWVPSHKEKSAIDFTQWKKPLMLGSVLILVYSVAVTSYLTSKQTELDERLGEKRKEMSVLLKTESKLRSLKERKEAYQFLGEQYPSVSNLVALLSPLNQKHVQLKNIQLNGSHVQIRGIAQSATKVFADLDANPLIQNVDFESSIMKDKVTNQDIFVISFDFKRGSLSEQ